MAANTKTATQPAVEYQPPPPAGCAAHERADWLPDLAVPFLRELRTRHREVAHGWAAAVDRIGAARDQHADLESAYRAQVRDAIAIGDPPPTRASGLDPAIREAHIAVAVEDAAVARDELAVCVVETLASLRAHRGDLHPHLGALSVSLLNALSAGAENQRALLIERMRRQVAELESDGPPIEVFSDQSPVSTPDLKEGAIHA